MDLIQEVQKIITFINEEEISCIVRFLKEKKVILINENIGMIMSNLNDSFNNPFFIGEILVNESEVEYLGQRGYGMSMGNIKEKSLIMAALDAALILKEQVFIDKLLDLLKIPEERMIKNYELEKNLTNSTKVNFGLMVEG